jgi:hypothetical protein
LPRNCPQPQQGQRIFSVFSFQFLDRVVTVREIEREREREKINFKKMQELEGVDMKSNRLRYHKTRAKMFYNKAEYALNQKIISNGFALKFETAALYFYQASVSYRASSKWREAGDALCRCGSIYHHRLKCYPEGASLYTEAAETYLKVDKNDTIKCYTMSISIYCDLGLFSIAGRLQKIVGDLHYEMKHYEEAAECYRKASDFLTTLPGQSDLCLEKAAQCFLECKEYQLACDLFVMLAESCVQSNLKSFQTKDHLFHAILCQIAIPIPSVNKSTPKNSNTVQEEDEEYTLKYASILTNISAYESIDPSWRCSRQSLFLRNLIKYRQEYDQHNFVDHLYYYHTVSSLTNEEISMLRIMLDEIVDELERRIAERKKEVADATRKQKRKQKLLKKRRQLRERGLNPFSIRIEDIEDDSDEEDGKKKENGEKEAEDEGDNKSLESSSSDSSDSSSVSSESSSGISDIELPDELKEKEEVKPPRRRRGK